jgi:hypothetical protein
MLRHGIFKLEFEVAAWLLLRCYSQYGIPDMKAMKVEGRSESLTVYANPLERGRVTVKANNLILVLCLTFVALFLMSGTSYPFAQKDLDKLGATRECTWCDLQNADLAGAQLSGAKLSNTSLSGANLSRASLSGADLSTARLVRANLSGANMSTAHLRAANLRDANLSNADLSGANLSGANLSYANISGINLSNADLSGAVWTDGTKCAEGSTGECKKELRPTGMPGPFPF